MVEPITQSFNQEGGWDSLPKYLPDLNDNSRLKLSLASAIQQISKTNRFIGVMENNHDTAKNRDSILSSPSVLAALSQNNFSKIFVEVSTNKKQDISDLRQGKLTPEEFLAKGKIWAWGENYEVQSFSPFVKKAGQSDIRVEPCDVETAKLEDLNSKMNENDTSNYFSGLERDMMARLFPELTVEERKDFVTLLYQTAQTAAEHQQAEDVSEEDDVKLFSPLTTEQERRVNHIIDMTYRDSIYVDKPSPDDIRSFGRERGAAFAELLGKIHYTEQIIRRAEEDKNVAKYITDETANDKAMAVMGAAHFSHDNGVQAGLMPMIRISFWANKYDYETAQREQPEKILRDTLGYRQQVGELAYFMEEGALHITPTTPTAIVNLLREQERKAPQSTPASRSAYQM